MTTFSTKLSPVLFLLLAVAVTFTACDDDNGPDPSDNLTVTETVEVQSELGTLGQALKDTDLDSVLNAEGPLTLFAPVDDAFSGDLSDDELAAALKYHVVEINLTFDDLKDMESVVTLSGDSLFISAANDTVTINDQAVITSDGIEASNGMVFIIDTLLTPPAAE